MEKREIKKNNITFTTFSSDLISRKLLRSVGQGKNVTLGRRTVHGHARGRLRDLSRTMADLLH